MFDGVLVWLLAFPTARKGKGTYGEAEIRSMRDGADELVEYAEDWEDEAYEARMNGRRPLFAPGSDMYEPEYADRRLASGNADRLCRTGLDAFASLGVRGLNREWSPKSEGVSGSSSQEECTVDTDVAGCLLPCRIVWDEVSTIKPAGGCWMGMEECFFDLVKPMAEVMVLNFMTDGLREAEYGLWGANE